MRQIALFPLSLFLAAVVAGTLAAQGIHATVVDGVTREPVRSAVVLVQDEAGVTIRALMSDSRGMVRVPGTRGDRLRLRIERMGYAPLESGLIELTLDELLHLEIRVRPTPVELEPITVGAVWRNRNRQGFERRMQNEIWGRFYPPERLESIRVPSTTLRLSFFIPGLMPNPDGTLLVRTRGITDLMGIGRFCHPSVFVDGWRVPGDMPIDSYVPGGSIRALEYYRDPATAPGEFQHFGEAEPGPGGGIRMQPQCAIIVIWTDYGFG
jgi:hypothetical protein